ncbi:MAG: cob(I)yrinic acid a,c-diamide adenosyltransferase [Steroidobacteraceae bacterium]
MGHRLSRIVTRTGDDGTTGLGDGQRVAKDAARIEAIGSIDELNCALGVLLAEPDMPAEIATCLSESQHELFDLGGEFAVPGMTLILPAHIERLENAVEQFNAGLPPLKEFILPGGGQPAAACHMARAICRRAERACWTLVREESIASEGPRYLNRLSDLLFVLARVLAQRSSAGEVSWRNPTQRRPTE